jgi:hypothetical protein
MIDSLLLIMTLCSLSTGQCDKYIIDQNLTIDDCEGLRIQTLIAHNQRRLKGDYGSYIQSMDCTIEDKE